MTLFLKALRKEDIVVKKFLIKLGIAIAAKGAALIVSFVIGLIGLLFVLASATLKILMAVGTFAFLANPVFDILFLVLGAIGLVLVLISAIVRTIASKKKL